MFLPHVQKVIDEAMKKPTVEKRLNYLFKTLGEGKACIKPASELTIQELAHWAHFFGLDIKLAFNNKKVIVKRRSGK